MTFFFQKNTFGVILKKCSGSSKLYNVSVVLKSIKVLLFIINKLDTAPVGKPSEVMRCICVRKTVVECNEVQILRYFT